MSQVLVVDDNFNNRASMKRKLGEFSISCQFAKSGEEALELAKEHRFDLIFLDISLPLREGDPPEDFGGIRVAEEVLCSSIVPKPVIVAVTAHGMDSHQKAILASGIHGIVQKGREDFYDRIKDCLVQNGLMHAVDTSRAANATIAMVATSVAPVEKPASTGVREPAFVTEKPSVAKTASQPPEADDEEEEAWNAESPRACIAMRLQRIHSEALGLLPELNADWEVHGMLQSTVGTIERAWQQVADESEHPARGGLGHWMANVLVSLPAELKQLENAWMMASISSQPPFERWKQTVSTILRFANNQPVRHEDRSHAVATTPRGPQVLPQSLGNPGDTRLHTAMVLIVDDTPEARRDLEQKTRNLGYRAVSCECAQSAIELLEQMRVDVCLVDMNMPGMSGIEFIQAIRVKRKNLPVIVVSGNCDDEQGAQAIHFGADDYLSKPAVECVLKARIESCLRQAESRRMELGKFLPARVAESVLRDEEILRRPKYSDITVMVCDIRGFSKICETRHPGETIQWICEVMNALSDIILESGGTIVDYVGDEIMAMWGSPIESEEHPTKACQCAIQVQHCVRQLSEKWFETLRCHWGVGIGVHSGLAICGNTGSQKRIKFGPLGNTVNLASRVQGTTKYLHSSILITRDTKNRIHSEMVGRRICKIRVNNLKEPVELFEIGDFPDTDRAFFPIYEEALSEFESSSGESNRLRYALTKTAELLAKKPDDGPSKLLMLRILQASLGDAFDPVWTMPGK